MAFDYTPKTIDDIVFHDDATEKAIRDIVTGKTVFPNAGKTGLLLYGRWGTGKSALAKILPQAYEEYRHGPDVRACPRYIDVIAGRNDAALIKSLERNAETMPIGSQKQHFVLNEFDMLEASAMRSLKTIMEFPDVMFVLVTNYINKVDEGVKDRCILINFNAAHESRWLRRARQIMADHELPDIPDHILLEVIKKGNGSARAIINQLVSFANAVRVKKQLEPIV